MSGGLSTLAPDVPKSAQERKDISRIVNKIIRQIAMQHFGQDLLLHVYCAGLWHGSQIAERTGGRDHD